MKKALKILILEDSPDDVDLIERQMKKGGMAFRPLVVKKEIEFRDALNEFQPDVILSDHSLPGFNSIEALQLYKDYQRASGRLIPFILITGTVSEEFAVQCIKAGAHDYMLKDRLTRLCASIQNGLEKCKRETEAIVNQTLMTEAEHLANFGSWQVDMVTGQHVWSSEMYNIYGYDSRGEMELSFEKFFSHVHPDDIAPLKAGFEHALRNLDAFEIDFRIIDNNGKLKYIHSKQQINRNPEGQPIRLVGFNLDISEQREAEETLKVAYREKVTILESIGDGFFTLDRGWTVTYWNKVAETHLKMPRERILGKNLWDLFPDAVALASYTQYHKAINENVVVHFEEYYPTLNAWFEVRAFPSPSGLSVYFKEITAQKKYITEIEDQNRRLMDIAWIQSHEVRAPLARMIGLIDLINKYKDEKTDVPGLLDSLAASAGELDGVIKKIVRKTEGLTP